MDEVEKEKDLDKLLGFSTSRSFIFSQKEEMRNERLAFWRHFDMI